MRREGNHEHCTKLVDRKDIDNYSTNHEEYDIYRCERVAFKQNYIQASIKAALKTGLNLHTLRYPRVYEITPQKENIYIWPLHYNDEVHGNIGMFFHDQFKIFNLTFRREKNYQIEIFCIVYA